MKKICALLLGFVLIVSVCGVSLAEASQKTVVGIAWRADTDSEFFTNVCRAVEAAGGEWVMLEQVLSSDLNYDEAGTLTSGKTEIGMLDETAAKYVKCNTWHGSNAAEAVGNVSIVLFTGGEDISPTLYYTPEEWHGIEAEIDYNAERDVSDYLTMAYCLDFDIPLMGFCRGAQMLGVISGAEIIQDIPTWFEDQGIAYDYTHRNQKTAPEAYRDYASHLVEIEPGSYLYDMIGAMSLSGCASWHHQAIKNVDNTRLAVTGYTETNGVKMIEAVERTDKTFAVGLQFHPEAALVKCLDNAANKYDFTGDETALSVFRYIVDQSYLTLGSWRIGSEARTALVDYVAAISDEWGAEYIPVEDRIAVFDLDGTLMCETYPRCFEYMVFVDYALNNPDYTPTEDVLAVAQEIVDTKWQEKPSGISTRQAAAAALAYAGMTPAELGEYVKGFMDSPAEGFTGMTRGEAFYLPMVELVDYLQANDFTVYIVTATERNIVRALVKDTLGIAPAYVIGTEYGYTATGQGDTADGDYTFQATDKVVFDGSYYGENAKMSKVDAIVREIGQQPVLAFGNSSGDVAMCEYVVTDNPYPALSYIVLADDEAREWGSYESAQAKIAGYNEMGIGTISMRDDFATIYGPSVEKDAAVVGKAQSSENSQSLSLTGVGNARELGGYKTEDGKTVKRGVLLRTAKLVDAAEEDIQRLLSVYHLAVDVDFRGDFEVEKAPDPEMEGVEYLNIHILDESAGLSEELQAEIAALEEQGVELDQITQLRLFMKYGVFTDQMYVDFLSSDVGKAGYAQFLQALLALPENRALLFHCSQGKDRTGCGAMLILFALGVDEETVMQDFLLTNEYNAALITEEREYLIENGVGEDEIETFMKSMDQVFPEFMENAIHWMTETYGSPLGYITQALGVTDAEIQALRDKFLE